MDDRSIGFIGLGIMGGPMAGHLAAAGYRLTVLDLDRAAAERLRGRFDTVQVADSPAEVAAASDVVVTMLPSGREVREVALGDRGLIEGFKPGTLLLDTSSAEPWLTREVASRLAERGVAMVDAPVSGAEMGAIAAELVFMVGGDRGDVARVRPLFEVMGKKMFHLGPIGSGHVMKSINNTITAVTLVSTAEGLILGKQNGLDPAVMNEVLIESTGMSWITHTHIAQRILSRRFDDPFKLDLMVKDMNIATALAAEGGIGVPVWASAQNVWREAQAAMPPHSSVSDVVRHLEHSAGIEISPGSQANEAK
ncbi:MAG: putative 6-phosphogluconate dehydrogenase protein [Sphingomonas bacterium]|nr:putative 6-phosphogluconate dehydrogenase protein [Sphingomonas bacterium]